MAQSPARINRQTLERCIVNSTREKALQSLFSYLKGALSDISVLRNEVLSAHIPTNGLVIMRDGNAGEPDVTLSPPCYIYKHRAEIEVFMQQADAKIRSHELDKLLSRIGRAFQHNPTLGNAVDMLTIDSPEFTTEAVEGAATISSAIIPITLEYVTDNPLT